MQETQEIQVWSLGGEDTLEEEMATHSSILASRIPWREKPVWATIYRGAKELDTAEQLIMHRKQRHKETEDSLGQKNKSELLKFFC